MASSSHSRHLLAPFNQAPGIVAAMLAATLLLAALSAQEYLARHWTGGPASFHTMLFAQAIGAVVWLLLAAIFIAPFVRRFPLRRERLARTMAVHVGASLPLAALHTFVVAALFASYYYGYSPAATWDVFQDRMHMGYLISVVIYCSITAAIGVRHRAAASAADCEHASNDRYMRRLLVRVDGCTQVLPVIQVDWLEAADNNVVVHSGAASHTVRGPLSTMATRLSPAHFARIRRSTVVNLESVREVQQWFHGELAVVLKDDTRLRVGRTFRDAFLAALEG
jgi:DNA-binding LytR/AlgR family response regulator